MNELIITTIPKQVKKATISFRMQYWKRVNIIILLLLLVSLVPSVFALIQKGFFVTDDGSWMIIRLSAFFDTLRDGQIPTRLLERLNNGYGYPVANFLYPGFLYIGSLIHLFGFGFIDSVKIILAISFIGSGIFTFLWLKKLFDPISSFIGSLYYVYTPYHLYDAYTRGSVGEVLALSFIPLVLWAFERKSIPLVAVGIFLLIVSHNSLALIVLPIITFYGILRSGWVKALMSISLGILMSTFFIVPALFELRYTKFYDVSISSPFEYFVNLELIGYSSIIVVILLLVTIIKLRTIKSLPNKSLIFLFFATFVLGLFLATSVSSFVWVTPVSTLLQFPFRVLSLLIISVSFIAAFAVSKWKSSIQILISIILVCALSYSAYPYLFPKERVDYPDEYYSTNVDTTTVKDEYLPRWVSVKPTQMFKEKFELQSGEAAIDIKSVNSRRAVAEISLAKPSVIRFNHIYYPGWEAYLEERPIEINYKNELGVMDVSLTNSQGTLVFVFRETPLRLASNFVSLIAMIFVFYLVVKPMLKFK